MNSKIISGILIILLPFFCFFPNYNEAGICHHKEYRIPLNELKDGDIILRKGKGLISELLSKTALVDQTFSHAGILLKFGNQWMVCHAIGGESNPAQGVQLESINDFTSRHVADSIAVFRYRLKPGEVDLLKLRCVEYIRMKVPFDSQFDYADDNALYCTEMVSKVFNYASKGRISLPLTSRAGWTYITCENLYHNAYAEQVRF